MRVVVLAAAAAAAAADQLAWRKSPILQAGESLDVHRAPSHNDLLGIGVTNLVVVGASVAAAAGGSDAGLLAKG